MMKILKDSKLSLTFSGAADPGGPGGPGPPLKLEIYLVKFLEKDRISFFFLLGPPLEKNRSSAPVHTYFN